MKVLVLFLALVAFSGSVSARTYDVCMSHCVPENGFDACNRSVNCGDAPEYTYGVCMSHCVPENGFDTCDRSTNCGDVGR